ncbi:MAG: class I SAM-dependent methyltransferase [Treponema sp.]|jgi:ubiquinone/menaquinone biosynthesis C-methylase UbiE|nr:class I SAM-dependent methyltransferase [Treponema sp.]
MKKYHFYGDLCSWFYDIDKPFPNQKDLDFYLSFADKNVNILEPMCGSGRFLVRFIEKGFNIDGFDISKEMVERCNIKIEKLNIKKDNILQCCDFKGFSSNKEYGYIFIPSGSFSLITDKNEIIENIRILEQLCKKNGKIVIDLLINENIGENIVSDIYSQDRVAKKDNIEIALFYKTTKIDEMENIEYSMFKYELYEDGKFIKEEEELFNVKYYKQNEFENYLKETPLKIENKYINNEKEKYAGQKTERIIYEIAKK